MAPCLLRFASTKEDRAAMDASSQYTPRPFLFPFLGSSGTMQKLSNYGAAQGQLCGFGTIAKIPTGHEPTTSTP